MVIVAKQASLTGASNWLSGSETSDEMGVLSTTISRVYKEWSEKEKTSQHKRIDQFCLQSTV